MKKIFRILSLLIVAGVLLPSCDEEVGFDKITNAPDVNASYFLQFINAKKTLETGVTEAGGLIEIATPIAVSLMGVPQTEDVTVNLTMDPSSTITSAMYTLSASSIIIPAGKTSGSVTLTTKAASMPVGQTLKFVMILNAGENNSPNANATKLTYNLKRIEFCPLVSGSADLVGSWSGEDAYYESVITTVADGANLKITGMGVGFIEDWWAESVTALGSPVMTVSGNGLVNIPRQYLFTTVYSGSPYDYEIIGSGKWTNCGSSPTLLITYDIYYEGEADGLAKSYAGYLGGIPYLTAEVSLDAKKSGQIIVNNLIKPEFKKKTE
jgi:hypothetical protein